MLGSGFEVNNTYCRIALTPVVIINAEVASVSTLFCVSPEASTPGEYDVEVSVGGVAFSTSKVKFQYVMGPVVSNIFPRRFASSGGTTLKIVGSNFVESSSTMCVSVRNKLVEATWFLQTIEIVVMLNETLSWFLVLTPSLDYKWV